MVLLRPTNHRTRTRTKQCSLQPLTDPAVLLNISGAMLIRFCKQIIVNTHCWFSRFHPTKGLFKNHKYFHDVLLVEQNFNPCEQTKLGVSLLIAGKGSVNFLPASAASNLRASQLLVGPCEVTVRSL